MYYKTHTSGSVSSSSMSDISLGVREPGRGVPWNTYTRRLALPYRAQSRGNGPPSSGICPGSGMGSWNSGIVWVPWLMVIVVGLKFFLFFNGKPGKISNNL